MSRTNIFFVSPSSNSGFVKNDLIILKRHFCVKELHYRGFFSLLSLLPQLIKGIFWSDVVFIWFASYHALLSIIISKLLEKKTVLVVGGYEVVNEPAINYGLMRSYLTSWIPRFSIKNADIVTCVSKYNRYETSKSTGCDDICIVYNAVDLDLFKPSFKVKKENIVLTVGNYNRVTDKKKGISTFIETAKYLPNMTFMIVGNYDEKLVDEIKESIPANLVLTGKVTTEKLLMYYQKAKIYCQISYHESFGVALAEAMACECVPVITNKGALPEVVGNTGFYVPYGDAEETANVIKDALNSKKGKNARERIVEMYSLPVRENKLLNIISEVSDQ